MFLLLANADGGTNLTYMAGAGPGFSIIDIDQKKITATTRVPYRLSIPGAAKIRCVEREHEQSRARKRLDKLAHRPLGATE